MEWFFLLMFLFLLMDIEGKLNKIIDEKKKGKLNLKEYLNKKVYLVLENEEIENDSYFEIGSQVEGTIVDYDEEWFVFSYYHKEKRKKVNHYLRIKDLISVEEIKE